MIRPAMLAIAPAISLTACSAGAAAAAPRAEYVAAVLVADELPSPTASAGAPKLAAAPDRPGVAAPAAKNAGSVSQNPAKDGRRAAIREPEDGAQLGALLVYPWSEGALYRLYAAPGQVSDIALQPGETLISVAAGDTVRWIIGDTVSGTGASRRTHVLVKPSDAGLESNMVIATDRRVYHVEVESGAGAAMTGIAWSYPAGALLALRKARAERPVASGIAVESLDFGYTIEGDTPSWRPLRAFDDGHQVFIQFPETLGEDEAPPLFVTGRDGRPQLVNYRVRGHYYVVDRLFAAAELRLGKERQQVVRIVRQRGWR
jgi:type IV secretion system protein VirB9